MSGEEGTKPTVESVSLGEYLTIRIDPTTKGQLARLAFEHDRTLAAEIRRAIRLYLEGKSA
jgi:predicted transcriptional regulator